MPGESADQVQRAKRAAVDYMYKMRELQELVRIYPEVKPILKIDLLLLGLSSHKSATIDLAKRLFRIAGARGIKFEMDARNLSVTSDFIDVVKALVRLGNNFRVVARRGRQGTAKLARVCQMRGIEYEERN